MSADYSWLNVRCLADTHTHVLITPSPEGFWKCQQIACLNNKVLHLLQKCHKSVRRRVLGKRGLELEGGQADKRGKGSHNVCAA